MVQLIHPELSFKVMGILFKVHNKLGSSRQEKHYQKAIAIELTEQGLAFDQEKEVPFTYNQEKLGDYYLDFVVENKIILELKAKDFYTSRDINQLVSYLKTLRLDLGIIVNFRSDRLKYRRIVNPDIRSNST